MRIVVALLLTLPASAHAQFYNGNDLHKACAESRYHALGYVMGVVDTTIAGTFGTALDGSPVFLRKTICIPDGVTGGQAVDLYCQYLDKHPESRHLPATTIANLAFSEFWRCPGM